MIRNCRLVEEEKETSCLNKRTTLIYYIQHLQDWHQELHEQVHIRHPHEEFPIVFEVFPITERLCNMLLLYVLKARHWLPPESMTSV